MKKLLFIICCLLFIPSVFAYSSVNQSTTQISNLWLPQNGSFWGGGCSSASNCDSAVIPFEKEYETDIAYYYMSRGTQDANGIWWAFRNETTMYQNHTYAVSGVMCSTGTTSPYWGSIRRYYTSGGAINPQNMTAATLVAGDYTNINAFNTLGLDFKSCILFSDLVKSNYSGMILGIRPSGSSVALGNVAFMGVMINDLGVDYAGSFTSIQDTLNTQYNNLNNNINNLNSSINSGTQNVINNQNANTNSIINNQNQNQQQTNQGLNNIDSSINNSNVDSPSSAFDNLNNFVAENSVISNLILMPVTLYRSVLNSINTTCRAISLGSLYGTDITIPCINLSSYFGSTLWGVIDVLISGFFIFGISKKMIKVFNHLSSLGEGDVIGD